MDEAIFAFARIVDERSHSVNVLKSRWTFGHAFFLTVENKLRYPTTANDSYEDEMSKQSTHFVRILDTTQVKDLHRQLQRAAGRKLPLDLKSGFFKIHAPDGDEVLSGMKHPSGKWLCRLHREVFDERVSA
jgi:hypothetical protein